MVYCILDIIKKGKSFDHLWSFSTLPTTNDENAQFSPTNTQLRHWVFNDYGIDYGIRSQIILVSYIKSFFFRSTQKRFLGPSNHHWIRIALFRAVPNQKNQPYRTIGQRNICQQKPNSGFNANCSESCSDMLKIRGGGELYIPLCKSNHLRTNHNDIFKMPNDGLTNSLLMGYEIKMEPRTPFLLIIDAGRIMTFYAYPIESLL